MYLGLAPDDNIAGGWAPPRLPTETTASFAKYVPRIASSPLNVPDDETDVKQILALFAQRRLRLVGRAKKTETGREFGRK